MIAKDTRCSSRWLWAVMLMLGSLFSAQAQTRDVITFTGGHEDPNNPGVYVIDVGDYVESEDGCKATITLSRPKGNTAKREASITLNRLYGWDDDGTTVTFQPGETIKEIELGLDYFWTSTGTMPTVYGVIQTNHADAAYQALMLRANYTATEELDSCYYTTSQEMLQQYLYENGAGASRELFCFNYGNYVLFKVSFDTMFRVTEDSRIVLKTRYTDHTGLPTDADDYGMSKTREVELKPINVGAVTDEIFFLYKPTDDELLYSFILNDNYLPIDNTYQGADASRYVFYYLSEVGPFEVAKPAAGAVNRVLFSRADLGESYGYNVRTNVAEFFPRFSNISINKTSFKSGETMVITAKMDNWHLMKRARLSEFINGFGVSFDNGETTEPYRFTLDETTGIVTYYATAPTVSQTRTVQVDFGPKAEFAIWDEDYGFQGYEYKVITGSEGMFKVTVSSQAATTVRATSVDFVNMPADGSDIYLTRGLFDDIYGTTFPLGITTTPANATNANTVTYSVTNPPNGAGAYIDTNSSGDPILNTGEYTGPFTLTATLANGVSTSRTYNLTTTPARPIHYTNTYVAGTSFPKFQFEIDRTWQLDDSFDWDNLATVNDDVTVNYTHANGTTWTEHYQFSKLKSHGKIEWLDASQVCYNDVSFRERIYDLPFSFTETHPDATVEQIGQPVVSAEVVMNMLNRYGNALQVRCTATLEPRLKDLSFSGYYNSEQHYHYKYEPTITSDVMYLPTEGFIVGYEIPELGVTETYDSRSGDPVPAWLELQQDTLYTTAKITAYPDLDKTQNYNLSLYTFAQRTNFPDEVMQRELSCNVSFSPVNPDLHMTYHVNGQNVTGDLTFDNTQEVADLMNTLKNQAFLRTGWYANHYLVHNLITKTQAFFNIYDDVFDGAEVTLTCEGDTIQHLTDYKGCFTFMPPSDEKVYNIEVYFPGYNRRYNNTFSSRSLAGVHRFGYNLTYDNTSYDHDIIYGGVYLSYFSEGVEKTLEIVSPGASSSWGADQYGFIYCDNPTEFFIRNAAAKVRIPFPDEFRQVAVNFVPELKMVGSALSRWDADWKYYSYLTDNYTEKMGSNLWTASCLRMRWSELISGNTMVEIVNSQGQPVTNATLNYACVDQDMSNPESVGTATYDSSLKGYQVSTDSQKYAELFEVVAPGYQPQLYTMHLWNYDQTSRENRGKQRRYTIVLDDGNESTTASLETLTRDGNLKNNEMNAQIVTTDLMRVGKNEVVNYTQTADYASVIKHVKDEKVGPNGWDGTKYAKMNFLLPYQGTFNTNQVRLVAADTIQLEPASVKHLTQTDFTSFSKNYCLMEFDLADQIRDGATVTPVLKNGSQTLVELPRLHNNTVDLQLLAEQNAINLPMNTTSLNNVDDEAKANGANLKDSGKAFDKFSFQLPPVFNFSVNIERNGDYFLVRGVYEKNFIPGGRLMEALDQVGDLAYFDEQYQACMDAVNSAKPMDDGFFNDIPRFPSAFVGIKGFVSGIGHINPETGKLEINFYDGGLTFEASARASASVSFGIGSFGMSVDAKIAMTMALINSNAMKGNVGALPTIDFMIDNQFRLKVCAWAQAGIDLWIAKAVVGVRGGASIDVKHRTILGTGSGINQTGAKTTLQAKMEAFAEARILWVKKKKTWNIFNIKKEYLTPNKPSNPFHEANAESLFSYRRMDVTKSYKKLRRKVIADLGTPIISNISGMARPTYLLGGESLVFNNLKTPSNYNDDCLQLYSNGSKTDLVDTGVEAPMYDFVAAHGDKGLEVVAFEQLSGEINTNNLEELDSLSQEKSVSEMNEIHVAWRQGNGQWQNQVVGSLYGNACVQPAVAVTKEQFYAEPHAAVIWQQGKAMFNDMGERYIDGSLMLSRYNGSRWSEPIELVRLNQRFVPVDYQLSIRTGIDRYSDSIMVAMTLKQDINNPQKSATMVYLSAAPLEDGKYKTRVNYTRTDASKPQMVRVLDPKSAVQYEDLTIHHDAANLVAYMKPKENGRDLVLTTVDMNGKPTGKLTGTLDMGKRTVTDFKLVADDDARDLDGVALLWTQSDEERTDNGDDTQNVDIKNRLYAAKLCSHDKQLYFSAPVEVATMPDDVSLASMDAYLDGLDMKVAYCVTNEEDGGAVMESNVAFTNAIDHKILFNPYEVNDEKQVPVTVTVANNGFQPIESIEVQLGDSTFVREVNLMPQETADVRAYYPVPDDFDGTIPYNVTAQFVLPNSNSLKMRRLAAARPRRIQQSGTQADVRQVDMATKLLKKSTEQNDVMTVVAEVNNASLLPLANNTKCKVGLYASPLATEPAPGTTEVTVNYSDLYDTTTKKNKVKIVSLTCDGEISRTLFLRTTPINGSTILTDVRPMNNVVPVTIAGKHPLGDANGDGKVSIADVTATVNYMNGGSGANFVKKAVDIDGNGSITNVDVQSVVELLLKQ